MHVMSYILCGRIRSSMEKKAGSVSPFNTIARLWERSFQLVWGWWSPSKRKTGATSLGWFWCCSCWRGNGGLGFCFFSRALWQKNPRSSSAEGDAVDLRNVPAALSSLGPWDRFELKLYFRAVSSASKLKTTTMQRDNLRRQRWFHS